MILDVADIGTFTSITAQLDGGPELRIRGADAAGLERGDSCQLGLDPEFISLWAATPGADEFRAPAAVPECRAIRNPREGTVVFREAGDRGCVAALLRPAALVYSYRGRDQASPDFTRRCVRSWPARGLVPEVPAAGARRGSRSTPAGADRPRGGGARTGLIAPGSCLTTCTCSSGTTRKPRRRTWRTSSRGTPRARSAPSSRTCDPGCRPVAESFFAAPGVRCPRRTVRRYTGTRYERPWRKERSGEARV